MKTKQGRNEKKKRTKRFTVRNVSHAGKEGCPKQVNQADKLAAAKASVKV